VFIDPVLTGYSRPAAGQDKSQFTGVREDVASVGDFIRLYTTRFQRWPSPKFLAGESYGTFRSAGVGAYLQQRHGMYITGISLISSVLDLKTLEFAVGHDLPYPLYLPAYTATAWFHRKLPADLQGAGLEAAVQQAREFAAGDYNRALTLGSRLPDAERHRISSQLARFTGLSADFIEQADLRVTDTRFFKELTRADGHTVGRLDSRFSGRDRDGTAAEVEYDASYAAIQGPFTAVLNTYLRGELGYHNDMPYEILGGRVQPWNWGTDGGGYTNLNTINIAEQLRAAMTQNPTLHVFVANGYYDLATPFSATEYTFSHLGGDPKLLERVRMTYYPAGHMMYIHAPSRIAFTSDARAFYHWALGRAEASATSGGR
jgi:carboxypeptidase C (cathepsin A)